MSRAIDGNTASNISATTAAFQLDGGKYAIEVTATWGGGNVVLQRLSADGSTYLPVHTAFTANNLTTADLPRGTYRWAVTTATAVYARATRIQGE